MNKKYIVEITQFKLVDGIAEEAFLQDAENVQKGFWEKQAGYAGTRQLLKGQEGEWFDIVHWKVWKMPKKLKKLPWEAKHVRQCFRKLIPAASNVALGADKKLEVIIEI